MNETIVIVPGIYTPRFLLLPLACRFKQQGYQTIVARHRYLMRTPEHNAQSLYRQIQQLNNPVVHLVGHSLGGLVILHLLNAARALPVKRVVLLGTPVQGSLVARKLHARPWSRWLLGKSVVNGLLHGAPSGQQIIDQAFEQDRCDIGVLYGTKRAGLAAMVFRTQESSDGVVLAAETELDAATDRVSIPHSHAIMLFSKVAADKALQYIRTGQFLSDQRYSNPNTKQR